jgi:hypothetical protein
MTMEFEHILVRRSGGFATVTMNRPQHRTALSLEHMRERLPASDARLTSFGDESIPALRQEKPAL